MTAEYEITKEDVSAFNLYHHRHSPTARRQYLRSWFVPAFIGLLVFSGIWYLADRERGTPMRTFLDLLPLFCFVPFYLLYFQSQGQRMCQRKRCDYFPVRLSPQAAEDRRGHGERRTESGVVKPSPRHDLTRERHRFQRAWPVLDGVARS